MGYNRAGAVRKARLRRRRREVQRFVERCTEANAAAQKEGKPPKDFTEAIKDFSYTRK